MTKSTQSRRRRRSCKAPSTPLYGEDVVPGRIRPPSGRADRAIRSNKNPAGFCSAPIPCAFPKRAPPGPTWKGWGERFPPASAADPGFSPGVRCFLPCPARQGSRAAASGCRGSVNRRTSAGMRSSHAAGGAGAIAEPWQPKVALIARFFAAEPQKMRPTRSR
jgi:hypothetical protein